MADYIYLIQPLRHEFFVCPPPREKRVMEALFENLKQAVTGGTLVLAGPCLDETFGVVVLRAENDEKASAFMLADPAVKSNVMAAELHPLKISLMEGR
jgi:uncharacterized protein YciI